MIAEHSRIFGEGVLESIGTDKGYYSATNTKAAVTTEIAEIGIQCPKNAKLKGEPNKELAKKLGNRRTGIEPLIGHAKRMGLAKSSMKSDNATLASGYRSILAFNLKQFSRKLMVGGVLG